MLAELSYPAKSLFGFGCYRLLLGTALVLFPNTLLILLAMAPTVEVWVRLTGVTVLILGANDLLAALAELQQVIRWSVPLRASLVLFLAVLVLLGYAPAILLLGGFVELAGAAWTWVALRRTPVVAAAIA